MNYNILINPKGYTKKSLRTNKKVFGPWSQHKHSIINKLGWAFDVSCVLDNGAGKRGGAHHLRLPQLCCSKASRQVQAPGPERERRAELYAHCFRKITQHARSTSHSRVGYLHVSHPTSWQLLLIPYICWILANKIHAIWDPLEGPGPPTWDVSSSSIQQ